MLLISLLHITVFNFQLLLYQLFHLYNSQDPKEKTKLKKTLAKH